MPGERLVTEWDQIYQKLPLKQVPWDEGKASSQLVELIESGAVEKGRALDICCGSANNAIYLARHGFSCYGLDISPTAIGFAQEKASLAGVTCDLLTGNAIHLTYTDAFFSFVFDRGCFHSIPSSEREDFIRGVHRVMNDRAKYLMICFSSNDPHPHAHAFSESDIRRYFGDLFGILSLKEFHGEADDEDHFFLAVLMEKAKLI